MAEDDDDRFTEDERTTANALRLQSISPTGRTLLGFFAFIPPKWRGPVAIIALLIFGYLALKLPSLVDWFKRTL